jgi:Protein of unknown function (DUF1552)
VTYPRTRRAFLRDLGLSTAALPFVTNLPCLGFTNQTRRKKRLVIVFSPNGVIPSAFWPAEEGESFTLQKTLSPLQPLANRMLVLRGLSDKIRGDGDSHMRGIGCLLTGIELFPGNVQGGSDTPAGWSSGISIDQEIKGKLQSDPATRTRFGSLEFGVMVPDRADTWTRMVYAGPNKPLPPIDDPYQMFGKLYGRVKERESLVSVLDEVREDLASLSATVSAEDRRLLDEHATLVREMELELRSSHDSAPGRPTPDEPEPGVKSENDNMPRISKMQIDMMVNSFAADFARVATLQYSYSVGQVRMTWLGINDGHHGLSHDEDDNKASVEKLEKIDKWFCEQVAYLAKRLAQTPEPGGDGSLLDNTLIVWTNELGKGNTHSMDNIPFVLVGNGLDFKMGRSVRYSNLPHNRLLLSLAHGMGHRIDRFGNPNYCGEGPLPNLS